MRWSCCGSINRLTTKIFFNDGEPLYGRNTGSFTLKPFRISLLKKILAEFRPNCTPDDLLALWTVTGGIPRYVDLMVQDRALTRKKMIESIFVEGSSYLTEGKTILAEEFGPDYGTYFSILSAIASGATTTAEMKNLVGADVNGYLTKLEDLYALVSKKDAEAVAHSGKREILGTRKDYERLGMSVPLCAAAICALSGEAKYRGEILATLRHYDYSTPNISEFFHAAVVAAAIGAFGDTEKDVLVRDGVKAGDFGTPQVIVTEVASERAHLAWPKIASDGGNNLIVGFVAARKHAKKHVSCFGAYRRSFIRRMRKSFLQIPKFYKTLESVSRGFGMCGIMSAMKNTRSRSSTMPRMTGRFRMRERSRRRSGGISPRIPPRDGNAMS